MSMNSEVSQADRSGRWGRGEVAALVSAFFRQQVQAGTSQRAFARAEEVPRTTLQRWLGRCDELGLPPEAVAFFESPAGEVFLHRLLVAAHLVMSWMGTCGIRLVGEFTKLAGLGSVLASSYRPTSSTSRTRSTRHSRCPCFAASGRPERRSPPLGRRFGGTSPSAKPTGPARADPAAHRTSTSGSGWRRMPRTPP